MVVNVLRAQRLRLLLRVDGQQEEGPRRHPIGHTSECDTVLYAAPRVEVLYKRWLRDDAITTHPILAVHAYLRLAKDFNTQRIAKRVNPNQRCIS
jgi:hypothetical protein